MDYIKNSLTCMSKHSFVSKQNDFFQCIETKRTLYLVENPSTKHFGNFTMHENMLNHFSLTTTNVALSFHMSTFQLIFNISGRRMSSLVRKKKLIPVFKYSQIKLNLALLPGWVNLILNLTVYGQVKFNHNNFNTICCIVLPSCCRKSHWHQLRGKVSSRRCQYDLVLVILPLI